MLHIAKYFFTILLCFCYFLSHADKTFVERKDVRAFINSLVNQYGFNKTQLINLMSQVQIQPQIIESMQKPYEKKNWDQYKALFLTTQRVQEGVIFWQKNQAALARA